VTIEKQDAPNPKTRVLFVDDEQTIRLTLPMILQNAGFDVSVAASVPEALELMNHLSFDVLLTDLNIGQPADGFTLVSAMRRVQPKAATFILTGYPDFQTALEAIRKQVDDYFTKPADIPNLVSALREKARHPRMLRQTPAKSVSQVVLENVDEVARRWLKEVKADEKLAAVDLDDESRINSLPHLLRDLAKVLGSDATQISSESLSSAATHGVHRAKQRYTIALMVCETRILNRVIAGLLHENLLTIDLSTMFSQALKIGEYLQVLLEESIRAFESTKITPLRKANTRVG